MEIEIAEIIALLEREGSLTQLEIEQKIQGETGSSASLILDALREAEIRGMICRRHKPTPTFSL